MYGQAEKKEKKPGKVNLDQLPASMKEKYTAMGIIPKPVVKKANIELDFEKMKQKKLEKEQPIEKKLEHIEIKATEKKALEKYGNWIVRVFQMLSSRSKF